MTHIKLHLEPKICQNNIFPKGKIILIYFDLDFFYYFIILLLNNIYLYIYIYILFAFYFKNYIIFFNLCKKLKKLKKLHKLNKIFHK